jgi:hypothetical protein
MMTLTNNWQCLVGWKDWPVFFESDRMGKIAGANLRLADVALGVAALFLDRYTASFYL